MRKEKQTEEMILAVKNAIANNAEIDLDEEIITLDGNGVDHVAEQIAETLYNAGYRKQSEGEWIERDCITESKRGRTIHYSTQKCSVCGKWNGRHKNNFCPHCGAKMKGGE